MKVIKIVKNLLLLLAITVIIFNSSCAKKEQKTSTNKKLKIAFVYVAPVGDAGWTWAHDIARQKLAALPIVDKTAYIESVPEGADSERVITQFAIQGFDIIFTTSFGYMDPTLNTARRFPKVVFEHCSGYKTAPNMGTYFGRMYQARYLTGLLAGLITKTNKIGYVAAHPIPEVIRGIDAFALGVKKANPKARVYVVWTHTWYNPAQERDAAISLLDIGCDILTQHQDSPATQQAAQEKGAYSIGYNTDMSKFAPKANLTSAVWNWFPIYRHIAENVYNGTWKPEKIWWGLDKQVVDIAPMTELVPQDFKEQVLKEKQRIIENDDIFTGPIYDNKNKLRVAEGSKMSDEALLSIDFFVDNVIGEVPK